MSEASPQLNSRKEFTTKDTKDTKESRLKLGAQASRLHLYRERLELPIPRVKPEEESGTGRTAFQKLDGPILNSLTRRTQESKTPTR